MLRQPQKFWRNKMRETIVERLAKRKRIAIERDCEVIKNYDEELYDADSECKHEVVAQWSGGVKCRKCSGWFCY
jgi:hypothetical protein